ncbi:MAG: DUF4097 family beta strand repeat protein [Propionibacteriales bacterium]|nr:DUF4097 family beta strand repeat protein [Propionibacteriales bacterium]
MFRFDTPTPPTLKVDFRAGSVTIDATETAETTVELFAHRDNAAAQDLIAATVVEQRGDTVVVHMPKGGSGGLFGRSTPAIDLRIVAPTSSVLVVKTGSADVTARGSYAGSRVDSGSGDISIEHLTGSTRLRAGSGDVSVDSTAADLDVQTGSGDVEIGSVSGAASVQAGSGDVKVEHVAGAIKAQTGSGDVDLGEAESDVTAQTGSGSVLVRKVYRGRVKATGASGDVRVGVAEGTAAWLDVHTLTGRVSSDLESADEPGADEEKVRLKLNSVSGDITVVRA